MTRDELIQEIERFASATGLAPATITGRAVGNSRLYYRLKREGDCTLHVAQRLRGWMASYASPKATEAAEQ